MKDVSLTQHHSRSFREFRYVYPVVSRRSAGVSIGVNLCKQCNFSCVYCQVLGEFPDFDRERRSEPVDLAMLEEEVRAVLELVRSGKLFEDAHFSRTPKERRRLNDIALSGDGEPTLSPQFPEVVQRLVKIRKDFLENASEYFERQGEEFGDEFGDVNEPLKLVLITNAAALHVKHVAQSVKFLLENGGELWAKLDAGTEETYRRVSRSRVPFAKILENITTTAKTHPILIQSIFLRDHEHTPDEHEIQQYCARLREILDAGGRIRKVQVYTVARKTPDPAICALEDHQLETIAEQIRQNTSVPVEAYFSR